MSHKNNSSTGHGTSPVCGERLRCRSRLDAVLEALSQRVRLDGGEEVARAIGSLAEQAEVGPGER